MQLHEAKELAIQLMNQHGLLDLNWYFEFDNAKRRFGICNYRYKKIGLSKHLVLLNDEARVKNTILHEIAHALVGFNHGHDSIWRMKAMEIGCDGERCYSSAEVVRPKGKYTAICPNPKCKHEFIKHKAPRGKQSCGVCNVVRRFNPDTILTWIANY